MTDIYSLVCQTAAKLQAEGKTPSLALVRANAGKGLDAATLFSAYQQWRNNPPPAVFPEAQPTQPTTTAPDFTAAESFKDCEIRALREDVVQLHAKVDRLSLQIEHLVIQLSLQTETANVRR